MGTLSALPDDATVRELAEIAGVCVRPVLSRVTDTMTGDSRTLVIPCGSTRASKCPSCAERARRLRMQQCREGWHLEDDPPIEMATVPDVTGLPATDAGHLIEAAGLNARVDPAAHETVPVDVVIDQSIPAGEQIPAGRTLGIAVSTGLPTEEGADNDDDGRRVRSTRRRQDAADLPSLKVSDHTTGRTFEAPDGTSYRPSMFLTLTLPSYGPVHTAAERHGQVQGCACGRTHKANPGIAGTPINPDTYDYRRAALDALHFPKLVDRFWQNLRRATGYSVQYFATIEPQKRLAAHLHAAVRGTFPRALLREVVKATYHQVWWPPCDEPVFVDYWPVWDELTQGYVDPATGEMLPTWDRALDALGDDEDAEPAHVIRFGDQVDMQGVLAGSTQADRAVGYLTKYLVKDVADDVTRNDDSDGPGPAAAKRAHVERLAHEVKWLPCSPTCANWLRFGVQPKNARRGLEPGRCRSKAHDREHLGLGGRRVLVSRRWTGKTLTEHRADRSAVVREVLAAAGVDMDDHTQLSANATRPDGQPRYQWQPVDPRADSASYIAAIGRAIQQRQRWRIQYDAARAATGPLPELSATTPEPAADAA